ncbi:MAG: phosphoribosylformylglycinamidine synthase subunit PurS [Thermoplasmata archaeon]|nr:phosphoribosylformylglycinamidine synthase subunit PurS [Thermoplasmata archaeon]MCI4344771.1 phosphoribosylformylglycinamidine synthase subunit PurS [Thermoplasmata archaeon]
MRVELKPGILDAEAESIQKSLGLLGVGHVSRVLTAKVYAISYEGVDLAEAHALTDRAVDQLLANPVVHRVTVAPARP